MISLRHVSRTFQLKDRLVEAVKDVSLEIDRGEFVIISGRSGCGKSTLLNLVAGMVRPTSGDVLLGDVQVWKLPDKQQAEFRNQKIGFVFQFNSLIPTLTVLENVLLPTIFGSADQRRSAQDRAMALLADVGLSDKVNDHPNQLSGGQQQRAAIARALINQPEVLLADEPTSNLDVRTEAEIMELIKALHTRTGLTILMVTHEPELIEFGTRSVFMEDGRIVPHL
jgi:ABC-type lipoprotein export system ATPase subunit